VYADYTYLQEVWDYHQQMVDAICAGELEKGYQALVEHKDLLHHRPVTFLMKNGTGNDQPMDSA
jgi:DNA-binding FadR family transcriptional regulator